VSNKGQLLQDPFLNLLRKEHVPVSIYLVNGIKLQGQHRVLRPVRGAAAQHGDADGLQARHFHRRARRPRGQLPRQRVGARLRRRRHFSCRWSPPPLEDRASKRSRPPAAQAECRAGGGGSRAGRGSTPNLRNSPRWPLPRRRTRGPRHRPAQGARMRRCSSDRARPRRSRPSWRDGGAGRDL
jgi:hypothetical protein